MQIKAAVRASSVRRGNTQPRPAERATASDRGRTLSPNRVSVVNRASSKRRTDRGAAAPAAPKLHSAKDKLAETDKSTEDFCATSVAASLLPGGRRIATPLLSATKRPEEAQVQPNARQQSYTRSSSLMRRNAVFSCNDDTDNSSGEPEVSPVSFQLKELVSACPEQKVDESVVTPSTQTRNSPRRSKIAAASLNASKSTARCLGSEELEALEIKAKRRELQVLRERNARHVHAAARFRAGLPPKKQCEADFKVTSTQENDKRRREVCIANPGVAFGKTFHASARTPTPSRHPQGTSAKQAERTRRYENIAAHEVNA